jgi:hypothetical protein
LSDLWQALGYDVRHTNILSSLGESADIAVLQGPPGVGKSWLAAGVGLTWEEGGGSTVVAQGDFLNADASLFPFGYAMSALPTSWKKVLPRMSGVARAGEVLLGTGGLLTSSIEAFAKARHARRGRRLPLSDAEQDILHDLERLSRKGPLLFVADNLHWWDPASLELLGRLRDPRMWEAFRFLSDLRVLAVQTPEPHQTVVHPKTHGALLAPAATRYFELSRVSRDGFDGVLEALGAGPGVSAEVTDAVYAFSGGHLALASRCAGRIAKGEGGALVAAADSDDFLRKILVERIDAMGERGQQALVMLQIAAVLGLTFRRDELACATGAEESTTAQLLRDCRTEAVLELDDGVGRFVHDLYRQHYLSAGSLDRTGIHEKLSDCLRVLRPGDYELRCTNAVKAERPSEAAAYAVQAALHRQREGLPWRELPEAVLVAMGPMTLVAERFETALEHLNQYRFRDCLEALAKLPRNLPTNLRAELDYLTATCLMVTRSGQDRADGRALLEEWAGYEEEEAEIGTRLMQLLLFALSMLVDKTPGVKLETRFKRVLFERAAFDPAAEDALYTLDRCAGRFHLPDRAVMVGGDAVEHFGPDDGQSLVRRPVEYYRCLINYGANLMANARHPQAREVHAEIGRLVASYPPGVFPRLDYAWMNTLLAEFRLGEVTPEEAVRRQREIIAAHEVDGDPFYVENALAVYLALADAHDDARDIFDRLDRQLRMRLDPEPSLLYLIGANCAAVRFVCGEDVEAEWMALAETLREVPYVTTPYLIRRHELLAELIHEQPAMTARQFDVCLTEGPPEFGPLWAQIGRGFWLPEIEWFR